MANEKKDLSLELFVVLSRASRAVADHSEKSIRSFGLNSTEFGVLELLYHKGEHPLQQIGEKILLTSGSITYVIDKLESKGLLVRRQCPTDRRITYADLTDKGRAFIQEIFPTHAEVIRNAVSALNDEEKKAAIELLKKLGKDARSKL